MRPHPYLRAYLAGVFLPSLVVPLGLIVFVIARYGVGLDIPIERAIIFPMAIVPNLWGVWNVAHLATRDRMRLSLGLHGAVLPVVLLPAGVLLAHWLSVFEVPLPLIAFAAPFGIAVYYLLWKHVVGFLNAELGVS